MRRSSHLLRFRLQIDVPRAIPQNSELLRMKSDYEKGGTTGVHVIAFLHPPAVAPVVASVVSKFTLCAHLASSPDWRPKRQCAAPGKAPIEFGTGCTSVVHLSVRLLYGVPGEAMSNIHVNNIAKGSVESTHKVPTSHYHTKHRTDGVSTFKNHNQLWSSQIVGEFRQFPLDRQLLSRARFIVSRRLDRRNSDTRRRVLGTALSSDTPTRDVRPPDFCGAPSGLTCL